MIFRVRLATSPPDPYVEIVSRHSGQCLDAVVAGRPMRPRPSSSGPAMAGRINSGGSSRPAAAPYGSSCSPAGRRSTSSVPADDVAPIIQWPVHGGANQAWTLQPTWGRLRAHRRAPSGKAMDVEFASADDGARAIQDTPHGGANQQWLLRPVE